MHHNWNNRFCRQHWNERRWIVGLCTFINLFSLLRQEKNSLQKEMFLKNCMNFLTTQETYGMVKKGCELVTYEFFDSVFLWES